MKILAYFVLFALSACSVHEAELPVLDLAAGMNTGRSLTDTFTLNDILEVVDIIPIETRPDALIGSATLEHIGRAHYYLRHDNKISIIARDGKIVNTIARQGRGPGEYLGMTVVDVNEKTSTIRIFDMQGDKYITYDMEGNLVDEGSLSEKGIELPRFIGGDYMVMRGDRSGTHRLYVTDRDMNILQGLFPMDTTLNKNDRWILTQQVGVGSCGDVALVNLSKEDTLYRVTKLKTIPEAILHKGQYRLPKESLFTVFTPDSPVYFSSTTVNSFGDYYFIRHMILGQIMEIWTKPDGRLIAHSDSRDGLDKYGFRFIFPSGGEARVSTFHFDSEQLAFTLNAVHAVGAIEGVDETDNPVIVIAKLKK